MMGDIVEKIRGENANNMFYVKNSVHKTLRAAAGQVADAYAPHDNGMEAVMERAELRLAPAFRMSTFDQLNNA